ncbi:MAG: DMT family transporter [Rhodobacteraceae bacterium]|nr:DMT family transporter [Paracoccaceae bacterium]
MTPTRRAGILMMVAAMASFSVQDGLSRYLAETYNTPMVVAFRYWVFAAYVLILAFRRPEGFRAAIHSTRLGIHVLRAVILVAEIAIIIWAYTLIGLIEAHAMFATCPLLVVMLSGPVLGEKLNRWRLVALAIGFAGVLVILRPGSGLFTWPILLPLASALLFSIFTVLTRLTARAEPSFPSFFWPAVIGAALMAVVGVVKWQPVAAGDWPFMLGYAAVAVVSNWLLLRTYEIAEAGSVQPFAYMQFVFIALIGILVFGESLSIAVAIGVALVIIGGLCALWSERVEQDG